MLAKPLTILALILALLACLAPVTPAAGQSAQVRDEAQRLRAEVDRLRAENERLAEENADLQRRNAALASAIQSIRRSLDGVEGHIAAFDQSAGGADAQPPAENREPLTSPAALFAALEQSHRDAFPDGLISDDAESQQHRRYVRDIQTWLNRVHRDFRGQTTWIVRPQEIRGSRGSHQAVVQVLNPTSLEPVGAPVVLDLPDRFASRMQDRPAPAWRLHGVLTPTLTYNPQRLERGVFDEPRFLAPMVEFGYTFRISGAAPTTEPETPTPQPREPVDR